MGDLIQIYNRNEVLGDSIKFVTISGYAKRPGEYRLHNNLNFKEPHEIIIKYLKIVLKSYQTYIKDNFCSSYKNILLTSAGARAFAKKVA